MRLVTPVNSPSADTPIQTAPGRIYVSGLPISDAHPHGVLTVAEVIQKSSNVGTVKMAMTMQPREMWEMFASVGLGQKPQIDFPGAVTGRVAPGGAASSSASADQVQGPLLTGVIRPDPRGAGTEGAPAGR